MKIKDLEKTLHTLKFHHLTEAMLFFYRNQQLNKICRTQAEAHLRLCAICERRLRLLQDEDPTIDQGQITDEEMAWVKQALQPKDL
jgi:hypothetical protein